MERIGQLLDDAVGGVVPREVDPVGAVLRRARMARTRRVTGASAVAGLMVVAAGVLWTGRGDPPARLASPATGPAVVTVAGGVVHAGGLHMPVPKGWKVAAAGQPLCSGDTRLVFINGAAPPADGCPPGPSRISVYGVAPGNNAIARPAQTRNLRLPGDQPAWVDRAELEALRTGPEAGYTSLTVAVPWSGARLVFAMPRGELNRILGTVRTDAVAPSELVLPAAATGGHMDVWANPNVRGWWDGPPARVMTMLAGLAGHAEPVDGGCAEDVALDTIWLTDHETDSAGSTWIDKPVAVLTVGCGQVTSSLGGRVRIDDAFHRSIRPLQVGG